MKSYYIMIVINPRNHKNLVTLDFFNRTYRLSDSDKWLPLYNTHQANICTSLWMSLKFPQLLKKKEKIHSFTVNIDSVKSKSDKKSARLRDFFALKLRNFLQNNLKKLFNLKTICEMFGKNNLLCFSRLNPHWRSTGGWECPWVLKHIVLNTNTLKKITLTFKAWAVRIKLTFCKGFG